MRFSSGCLAGILLGVVSTVVAYFGYTFLFSRQNLELIPVSASGPAAMTVSISEQLLDEELSMGLASQGGAFGDVAVDLHAPNRAQISTDLQVAILGHNVDVHPVVALHFGATQGRMTLNVDSVDVSGFTVPRGAIDSQVTQFTRAGEAALNRELARILANTGLHLTSVEATEDSLIFKLSK